MKDIRRIELADQVAFERFQAMMLAEKAAGNPFIETKKVNDFPAFVEKSHRFEDETDDPDWARSTTYYYFLDGEIVAKISCRWELKGMLSSIGGHIGYATRKDFRGRGLMTELLAFALDRYRERGIGRVLIVALQANEPSRRTIERAGGVLENIINHEGQDFARYWIDLEVKK
ncbi:GNAT family N-acetyltransferase [Streptococcus cuniculipharyngis]|uniref:GNAT family N-acetyltransferase n=1 Tax=Streptococcus cuniculipharyngis TaxID=1562651 RepID=A0A5C5SFU5_9STRE|nr:GNAT family N-acetyltransferase [Streptococcus cuniculipharyngis]TWS99008.1 GNAT family N-acetyltransferase [Streptococcus cuniculipharyngis]